MKLAELLIERSEIQKRITIYSTRLSKYATVQEGDTPPFRPQTLLEKLDTLFLQHEAIICKINTINMNTEFEPGMTLAMAVTKRDVLKNKRSVYSGLFSASAIQEDRYSRKEIKFVSTMDVDRIMDTTDDLSKEIRLLDARIQAKNWEVDVI